MPTCRAAVKPLAILSIVTTINPIAAVAQQAAALEEVVVTARKREESLQDIPLAVTALGAAQIEMTGAVNIADLQSQVPSLTAYPARGTSSALTAYIRGVGQSDPLYGVEPGVGLYLDDVYVARPQGALLEIFDVERIEVLRGPQGTLYGRNSIGGAIKYVSKPLDTEPQLELSAALGNYDRRDASLTASGPLMGEALIGKIAVMARRRDGFGENRFTGDDLSDKDVTSGHIALQWRPNQDWSLKLAADHTRDRSAPPGGQRMIENPAEARVAAMTSGDLPPLFSVGGINVWSVDQVDLFTAANGINPLPVSRDRYDTDSGLENPRNDTDTQGISLTVEHNVNENWLFKSITAYREGDTDTTIDFDMGPLPLADVYAEYFDDQLSQEFQLNYDDSDRWQAVAGVYYFRGEAGGEGRSLFLVAPTFEPGSPNNPLPFATTTVATLYTGQRGTVDTTSYALYGDVTWQLSETVGLSFGARYTWEEKEVDILAQSFTDASFSQVADTETDFQDTESWSDFSPRIGLDIQLSDTALLYASVSNGFKSGGFNIRARQNIEPESTRPYDPEEVTAYELGIKSNLGERVTLNVAYFYSDYDDIQLSIFSRASDGTFFGDFTNAGEGVIQGVELEFTAAVSDALFFSGNLAYLDAEYKEFLDRGVDIADDQAFTNTPPWAATLNSHYTHTLGALGDVQALLTVSYRDEMYPTTDLSEVLKQESYTTVDASVAWTSVSAQWRVALEGRNLTDEEYRTSGYDLQASSGIDLIQGFYGSPRTYAVRLDYRF